jgi:hypothetical protein
MSRTLIVAAAGCLLTACANQPDSLSGSISQAFDLSFSSVTLARNSEAFQVSYLRSDGNEIVMRVTVDTTGLTIKAHQAFDISGDYAPCQPRTSVVRAVACEPLLDLPPLQNGQMTLDNSGIAGETTSGSFAITLQNGPDLGGQYTINGNFEGLVVAAP